MLLELTGRLLEITGKTAFLCYHRNRESRFPVPKDNRVAIGCGAVM
jgi:hypothetical protein